MHKITAPLDFACAYPRPRRAKSGVFCIVVLSAPPLFCNIRAQKLFMPVEALPKLMLAPPETTMLVLKRNIKATGDVVNASNAYTHGLAC